jgi:hypothetical protein
VVFHLLSRAIGPNWQGQWLLMVVNIIASNVLCLPAVLAGAAISRGLTGGAQVFAAGERCWCGRISLDCRIPSRMAPSMAVQVTMYLTEGDSWHHRPLHVSGSCALRDAPLH